MTESEIRKYDPEDVELKALMGDKFQDKSQEAQSEPEKTEIPQASKYTAVCENEAAVSKRLFPEGFMKCAGEFLAFLVLNCLILYWQYAGLVALSVALPSVCVCSAFVGNRFAKLMRRWK